MFSSPAARLICIISIIVPNYFPISIYVFSWLSGSSGSQINLNCLLFIINMNILLSVSDWKHMVGFSDSLNSSYEIGILL